MQMLGVLVRTACSLAVVALILPDLAAGAQHLCGRELADTLALVCHGRGFRTADDRNKGSLYNNRRKRHAEMHHAVKRQVVNECCIQSCSYTQLESYCAPGPAKAGSLGGLLKAMKGSRGAEAAAQAQARQQQQQQQQQQFPTTTVMPLYGGMDNDIVAIGDKSSDGSDSRVRASKQDSPYFRSRSFFFVTPARSAQYPKKKTH